MRCPFHEDRNASASVNPDENVFRCHTCDIGGDSYVIVAWKEGISDFPGTVAFCESVFGGSYGAVSGGPDARRTRPNVLDEPSRGQVRGQRSILSNRRRRPTIGGP